MRAFDSVRFQVQGGSGPNVGLSELEVYALPYGPDAQQNVVAEAADGSATVSWDAPEFDGGIPITGYLVTPYQGDVALDPFQAGADVAELSVPNLLPGETYRFSVTAQNMSGPGDESALSEPVRIGPPPWEKGTEYDTGDKVSYDGAAYIAQWWTTEVPGASATGSWMEQGAVSTCAQGDVAAWTASQVYKGGEDVLFDGEVFEAQWWTRNQQPVDSGVLGDWLGLAEGFMLNPSWGLSLLPPPCSSQVPV